MERTCPDPTPAAVLTPLPGSPPPHRPEPPLAVLLSLLPMYTCPRWQVHLISCLPTITLTLQQPSPRVYPGYIPWERFPDSSTGKESPCSAGDPGLIPESGRSPGEGKGYPLQYSWASLVARLVKNPPALQETWI